MLWLGVITFLSEFWLTLLDRAENHITERCTRQSIQMTLDTVSGDHVDVLGSGIVCAVNQCGIFKCKSNFQLLADLTSSTYEKLSTDRQVWNGPLLDIAQICVSFFG